MCAIIDDWGIDTSFAAMRQEICNTDPAAYSPRVGSVNFGPAEQIPLQTINTMRTQPIGISLCFNRFSDRMHGKVFRNRDQGLHQNLIIARLRHATPRHG